MAQRTTECPARAAGVAQYLGKAKVDQLQVAVRADQNVLWLQVAVHDIMLV